MDQRIFVARLNIEHYRQKLATELDEATRQQVVGLLFDEEAKLTALTDPPGRKKESDQT